MAARIRALHGMTVPELRAEYAAVFGEETRSRHREFLFRQIAWRMQALAEGGLSERARARAAELAKDADIRLRAPRDAFRGSADPAGERTATTTFGKVHDARLPLPGTVLSREYRGKVLKVTVLDGAFEYAGRSYRSLSAIANEVTRSRWNGFAFFGLATPRDGTAGDAR